MKRLALLALIAVVVGCAQQANFRHPRPDELRPGDIAPPPGPFVDSMPHRPIYVAPMPPPYQIPMPQPYRPIQQPYQAPREPLRCTSRWVGNVQYTDCY